MLSIPTAEISFGTRNSTFLSSLIAPKVKPNKSYYNKLLAIRTGKCNSTWIKHSVKKLAEEITISESYFQHLYKKYFGVLPIADEINSHVEYSKQLLSS